MCSDYEQVVFTCRWTRSNIGSAKPDLRHHSGVAVSLTVTSWEGVGACSLSSNSPKQSEALKVCLLLQHFQHNIQFAAVLLGGRVVEDTTICIPKQQFYDPLGSTNHNLIELRRGLQIQIINRLIFWQQPRQFKDRCYEMRNCSKLEVQSILVIMQFIYNITE